MLRSNFYVVVILMIIFSDLEVLAVELDMPVSPQCMSCICEACSSCNTSIGCEGEFCGPFNLFSDYWADAGAPTIKGQSFGDPTAFFNCGRDPYCSMLTIQKYMQTYQQDCNGDGAIDCDDFALIHKFGGYGKCKGASLPAIYEAKYQQCKHIVGA